MQEFKELVKVGKTPKRRYKHSEFVKMLKGTHLDKSKYIQCTPEQKERWLAIVEANKKMKDAVD